MLNDEDMALRRTAKDIDGVKAGERTSMTAERTPTAAIASGIAYGLGGIPAAAATYTMPGVVSRALLGEASTGLMAPYLAGAAGRAIPQQVE